MSDLGNLFSQRGSDCLAVLLVHSDQLCPYLIVRAGAFVGSEVGDSCLSTPHGLRNNLLAETSKSKLGNDVFPVHAAILIGIPLFCQTVFRFCEPVE